VEYYSSITLLDFLLVSLYFSFQGLHPLQPFLGKELFLVDMKIHDIFDEGEFFAESFVHGVLIELCSGLVVLSKLFLKQDHHDIVQFSMFFHLLFQNMVVIGQLGLLIVTAPLHEKRLQCCLVTVQRFNLVLVYCNCSLQVLHLPLEGFRLLYCRYHTIDFFQLELYRVVNLPS